MNHSTATPRRVSNHPLLAPARDVWCAVRAWVWVTLGKCPMRTTRPCAEVAVGGCSCEQEASVTDSAMLADRAMERLRMRSPKGFRDSDGLRAGRHVAAIRAPRPVAALTFSGKDRGLAPPPSRPGQGAAR